MIEYRLNSNGGMKFLAWTEGHFPGRPVNYDTRRGWWLMHDRAIFRFCVGTIEFQTTLAGRQELIVMPDDRMRHVDDDIYNHLSLADTIVLERMVKRFAEIDFGTRRGIWTSGSVVTL